MGCCLNLLTPTSSSYKPVLKLAQFEGMASRFVTVHYSAGQTIWKARYEGYLLQCSLQECLSYKVLLLRLDYFLHIHTNDRILALQNTVNSAKVPLGLKK